MDYIKYSEKLIKELSEKPFHNLLTFGLGYSHVCYSDFEHVLQAPKNADIIDYLEEIKYQKYFKKFTSILLIRVLEHLPIRSIDYYLYNIYSVLSDNGILICTVPDMDECFFLLKKFSEFPSENFFQMERIMFEIFNEGNNIMDRHSIWTNKETVKHYLEREKLFEIEDIKHVQIDSSIAPESLEFRARKIS